jgi:phosphoglycolate phosphatase
MTAELPIGLIVFDVDGTLVDSQHGIIHCMRQAFAEHGRPAPQDEAVRRIVGLPLEDGVAEIAPDLDDAGIVALSQSYRQAFFTHRQSPDFAETLFAGTENLLGDLARQGPLLGIATGKSRRGLNALLDRYGWHGLFVTTQTGDIPPGKPAPDMLLRALAEAGVAPEHALMVGDTTYDILMARAAGVRPIGVPWGNHPAAELLEAGAERVIGTWDDLLAIARAG